MTLNTLYDGQIPIAERYNENFGDVNSVSIKNHIRTLIDRTGVYGKDGQDVWGESYISFTGRNSSIKLSGNGFIFATGSLTPTTNKPTNSNIILSGTTSNIISYWKFDNIGSDFMAVGANASITNGTYTNVGLLGNSLDFVGNGVADLGSAASYNTIPFSFVSIFKTGSSSDGSYNILSKRNTGSGINLYLQSGTNFLVFEALGTNGSTYTAITAGSYNDNQWHSVVSTITNSGLKLYSEGTLVGSYISGLALRFSPENLKTGSRFVGLINGIGFYNRELTASESTEIHNSGAGLPLSEYNIIRHVLPSDIFLGSCSKIVSSALVTQFESGVKINAKVISSTDDSGWKTYNTLGSFSNFTNIPTELHLQVIPVNNGSPTIYGFGAIVR